MVMGDDIFERDLLNRAGSEKSTFEKCSLFDLSCRLTY